MNADTLESVGSLAPVFGAKLTMLTGECAEHGQRDVLTRIGDAWTCPYCLEATMKAEAHDMWLAQRTADLMRTATIPGKYVGARFEAKSEPQRVVKKAAATFRDFILRNSAWAALILAGKTGTGKTLLACELAQALMSKASRSVRYITAAGMISEIQASYKAEGKSEEGEILRFVQFDVLILDEIDAIRSTENANLLLTEIINRRYNENKPVIVISNQSFDTLAKYVGDRVHSRLHENAFNCDFSWGDMRKQGAA